MFTRMLHGVEQGKVRAVHRTRVASRRLREVLPILQLEQGLTRRLTRRLRRVTDRLGSVRELDVLLLVLDELHDSGRFRRDALESVAAAVREDRDAARKHLFDKLPMAELRRLAARLERMAHDFESVADAGRRRGAWRWAVDARVAHRGMSLREAMREAGAVYLPDRLHAVRIALKKVRYAVEMRDELAGVRSDELSFLRRAQDILGRMHDLQMLIDRVRQAQVALAPMDAALWNGLDALVGGLEDDCRRLHARYMRAKPTLEEICTRAIARPRAAARRAALDRAAS